MIVNLKEFELHRLSKDRDEFIKNLNRLSTELNKITVNIWSKL